MGIAGDVTTWGEAARQLSAATGAIILPCLISDGVMLRLMRWLGGVPERAARDVVNMLAYCRLFNAHMVSLRSVEETHALHPGSLTLRDWAFKNRQELVQVLREGRGSTFMKGMG